MEIGKSSNSVPRCEEIAIPIEENGHGPDRMSIHGGDSKHSTASESGSYASPTTTSLQQQEKGSNEGLPKYSENSMLSPPSNTIKSDSTTATELLIRRPSVRKSTFSSPKSRMVELETQTGSSLAGQIGGWGRTSYSAISVCSRAEMLRTGSLPPAKEHDKVDDEDDDDDDDDDIKEDGEGDEKTSGNHGDADDAKKIYGKPPLRKVWKRGKFKVTLKAINSIIEWMLLVGAMVMLIVSIYADELKIHVIWGLEIWKWCVLVAVFFCGRLVTKWARDCLVFLIESKYLFNEKVVYFVHGVKQSVRVVIWLSLVLLAWFLLIDRGVKKRSSRKTIRVLNYITRALAATLIGAVLWMIKTLLVKLIAASFHVKTFFSKIKETISQEYVLWALSVPQAFPLAENGSPGPSTCSCWCIKIPRWKGHRQNKDRCEITMKKLGKMRSGKIPVSTMGGLVDRIRSSKMSIISNALEVDGGEQREINSKSDVEEAALQIFQNVKRPHLDYIEEEDLSPFKNKENAECLQEWFQKVAEAGKINKAALTNWAVNALKERDNLSHSLKDAKTAIEELNRILSALVLVLIAIVWLLLMGFATTKVLVVLSSQLLVAVFVFGNTCRTVFEAMIFVFIMHPFDVGDRCVIDGVIMVVEEMDILKTSFLRYDNEMVYYPNSVLASKVISNYNRSPEKMGDNVTFDIDVSTPCEVIQALRDRIKEHILKAPVHWHPDHSVQIKEIENMNKMKMVLFVNHKINFQEYLEKMNRRTTLMLALKQIFEDLNIKYHLLPQQVQLTHYNASSSILPAPPPRVLLSRD